MMTTNEGPLTNPPSFSLECQICCLSSYEQKDLFLALRARLLRFARCFALRAPYIAYPIFKSIYVPKHSSVSCKAAEILADVKTSRSVLALRARGWPRPTASAYDGPWFKLSTCQNSAL